MREIEKINILKLFIFRKKEKLLLQLNSDIFFFVLFFLFLSLIKNILFCLRLYEFNRNDDHNLRRFAADRLQSCRLLPFPTKLGYHFRLLVDHRSGIALLAWTVPARKKQEFSGLGRELNVLFTTYRSVTVCVHKLAEWSVFLNFKLHYCIVLS